MFEHRLIKFVDHYKHLGVTFSNRTHGHTLMIVYNKYAWNIFWLGLAYAKHLFLICMLAWQMLLFWLTLTCTNSPDITSGLAWRMPHAEQDISAPFQRTWSYFHYFTSIYLYTLFSCWEFWFVSSLEIWHFLHVSLLCSIVSGKDLAHQYAGWERPCGKKLCFFVPQKYYSLCMQDHDYCR